MSMRLPSAMAVLLAASACARAGGGGGDSDTAVDGDVTWDGEVPADGECVPGAATGCVDGSVWSFDSCGNPEDLLVACSARGECTEVAPGEAECACIEGWGELDCGTCVRYVDAGASGAGTGMTWSDAATTIAAGIDGAREKILSIGGPSHCEVWVGEGTWWVHQGEDTDTIRLLPGVHLHGSFAGTEKGKDERAPLAHPSILSGNEGPAAAQNVHHVLSADEDTLVEGFTITAGLADGASPDDAGGGLLVLGDDVTVRFCVFARNGASTGGALAARSSGGVTISGCVFNGNEASSDAGALLLEGGEHEVRDSIFALNDAGGGGGAVSVGGGAGLSLASCVMAGNAALGDGGAVLATGGSVTVTNCTFFANTAATGEATANVASTTTAVNSIFWSGSGAFFQVDASSSTTVTWSDVQGGWPGEGNIDADPLFADAAGGDFHLSSGSPCIDAADGDAAPENDIVGVERQDDPDVADTGTGDPAWTDMGAFERIP